MYLTFYEHLLFLCHFTTSTPISNTYVSLKDKLMLFCGNVLVVLPLCIALLNPFNGARNISLNGPSSSVSKLKGNYLPFDFWLLTNCGVAPRTWYRANRQKIFVFQIIKYCCVTLSTINGLNLYCLNWLHTIKGIWKFIKLINYSNNIV